MNPKKEQRMANERKLTCHHRALSRLTVSESIPSAIYTGLD
ncbi:hypothetical protein VRK_26480 [Vibrio sp. MEBiC08052]|nr:hypothetical protein VRK_26480 [Vibrio sp. MEBiC08052]